MIKIGIVGAGGIARSNHLPSLLKLGARAEVLAIADVDSEAAESARAQFGVPRAYSGHREMLEHESLDAVIVATPNREHLRPVLDSLEAGIHVLSEKPLGRTAAEAKAMVSEAEARSLVLQVGFQLRFCGVAQFLQAYIDRGEMGDVYFGRAQALRRRVVPGWGAFIDKEVQGGGPLLDIGIHALDLTLMGMGYPKPVTASASAWNHLGTNPELFNGAGDYDRAKFTVEDFAAGFIRFDNGAALSIEASFMANQGGNVMQSQLYGTKAGSVMRPGEPSLTIHTEQGKQLYDITPVNVPVTDPAVKAAEAFLDAIEGRIPCAVPGREAYVLNAIIDALYASAASGREQSVQIDL